MVPFFADDSRRAFNSPWQLLTVRTTRHLFAAIAGTGFLALSHSELSAQSLLAGDLLVTRSTYEGTASTVTVGQALPGGGNAVADGTCPNVFNNETPDPNFGVTSPIFVDQYNLGSNTVDNTINVTQLVTAAIDSSAVGPYGQGNFRGIPDGRTTGSDLRRSRYRRPSAN